MFDALKISKDGWQSEYTSVNNLLLHLKRKTKSESSRQNYLGIVDRLCRKLDVTPDEIVSWNKKKIEKTIQNYCDEYADSKNVVNPYLAYLTKFFYVNGFRVGKHSNLNIDSYYCPSRYRKTIEYIPSEDEIKKMVTVSGVSLRDRVIILLLYQSGLRNSTLRALRWNDIELDTNKGEPLLIQVTPEMKKIVPDACKGSIPYFTFAGKETVEALKLLRAETENKYGIKDDQIIFMSLYRSFDIDSKRFKPITRKTLCGIITSASKKTGLKNWKFIRPHTFRKTFERALRNSKLDGKDQEYLMGHILPGSQDTYYTENIEELRIKYSQVTFFQEEGKINALRSELQKQREEIEKQAKEIELLQRGKMEAEEDRFTHNYRKEEWMIDREKWERFNRDQKDLIEKQKQMDKLLKEVITLQKKQK